MSGFSRVSIPPSLRKTIHDIKEITGKHSDEDVYAMLKECNMDPNETAQNLLYLDTFHEVKRKRDRRKVSANNRAVEENRQTPGIQRQGTRAGNYYSNNPDETVGGKPLNGRKQNGYSNPMRRASKSSVAALHKERNAAPTFASSTAPADGLISSCSGSSSKESTSHSAEGNMSIVKDIKDDYDYEQKKFAIRPLNFKQLSMLCPGPTPTSTPTNPSNVAKADRNQGGSLKRSSSRLGNSIDSSSAVLEQAQNPQNSGSVGIIKSETENQQNTAEISANLLADSIKNAVQNVNSDQAISGSVDLISNKSTVECQGVERSQAESSPLPPSSHPIAVAKGNPEICSLQQVNSPPKAPDIAPEANSYSHHKLEVPSEKATSEVDANLHKLRIEDKQCVIFPNHLHVPEALKKALTFGSLDVAVQLNNEASKPSDVSVPTHVDTSKEPSSFHKSSSPTPGGSDYPDRGQSPAQMMVNLTTSQENESSGNALKYDQSKWEMVQPVGRPHNPLQPPMSEHAPNLSPPGVGPYVVKLGGHEPQGGKNSQILSKTGSTPAMIQPRGIGQSSLAVSPPLFPLLRQPYPPNYIPYSPYFPHLYMHPQNAHHLLTHSGFPQQPSAGNIFMPPTATATASVKFPIYKPGHFGISPYYGASGLSYSCGNILHPGPGSDLKEKDMYPTLKQNEDLHVLNPALGREISAALQANVFYNLPQGQPMAFPHATVGHNSFPAIYHHPSQSISTPSLVQSQPAGAAVPPQPHTPPLLPLSQQQCGQRNWNHKLLNRDKL